jgi:hypothetical protein
MMDGFMVFGVMDGWFLGVGLQELEWSAQLKC